MKETFAVKCPKCETILIIDRRTGKTLEVRKPLVKASSGDRFEDAILKMKKDKATSETEFDKAMSGLDSRSKKLDKMFKESLKEVQEDGDEGAPPIKPFDLD